MIKTFLILGAWAIGFAVAAATAQEYREPRVLFSAVPEGRGCYWSHEQLLCARYCYTEINGHRYCREHEADAVSQAPWRSDNDDGPQRAFRDGGVTAQR